MKRALMMLAALVLAAGAAQAQDPLTNAKNKALKAKAAADAHTAAEQRPEPTAPAPTAPAPTAKQSPSPRSQSGAKLPEGTAPAGSQLDVAKADTGGPAPTIYREVFRYSADGRRDPFVSLMTTTELRPALSDLRLTGILFDHSGRNSIATFRDMTNNNQYRVGVGSVLGRMRVTAIRTLTVVFTVDEFGTTRRDSITLRDSTNKARGR
jgi:hypothetical protein